MEISRLQELDEHWYLGGDDWYAAAAAVVVVVVVVVVVALVVAGDRCGIVVAGFCCTEVSTRFLPDSFTRFRGV